MKIPHHKYVLTLVAGKLSNQEIMKDLQKNSLQAPPSKEVNALREELKLGQEDYFAGKDAVDLGWLREHDIEAMFGYRFDKQVAESIDGIDGAFKVLNDQNMYRTITSLAMSGVTPEDIELIVNGKYDIEYSSADLDQFLKYFFNIKEWSRYEKDDYTNNIRDQHLQMFYSMALEEEKDYLMWKLGVAPNKSFDAMLRDMTVDSYYNFKEQSTRSPDQAHKWGMLMLKVQERLEKVEKDLNADADASTDLEQLFGKALQKQMDKKDVEVKPKKKKNGEEEEVDHPDPFAGLNVAGKEVPNIVNLDDLD